MNSIHRQGPKDDLFFLIDTATTKIYTLSLHDALPISAIIFLPTRRKCDEAASEVAGDRSQKTDPDRQKKREAIFLEFAADNPEIVRHKHQKILVNEIGRAHV